VPQTRWNRAKQVFHDALEKTGPERARVVAVACGDDHELRAQVEALLAAHDEAGDFMASPTGAGNDDVARAAARLAAAAPSEAPGTRVGPYKLLQVIGEGGFGVVYMAEQEQPIRRRVALKIIKLGMDSKEVIARFEAERQALAMMDHPNIARVLDAGATASGRPYFVMELVKGVPITDYCDANHLSTRERLDLFADLCKAIHHAHEKGIIHRDIKPSNVMVTLHDGTPVPKIIDFGIAKATNQRLTEKTLFTAYGAFVGTPAYMSPEQTELSGLEVDRRSDIYSLGVLLYELLTGTTPLEAESLRARAFLEVMRIIREDDPPTPSARLQTLGNRLIEVAGRRQVDPTALAKLVRGDLDWIVMKALDKDRRRRYGTASELVDDLTRYFRDEPVSARRPSAAYRFGKFARRRRGPILAAASIVGAIAIGGFAAEIGGFGPAGRGSADIGPAAMRTQQFTEVDSVTDKTWRDFQGLSPDGTRALFGDYTTGQNFGVYEFAARKFSLLTDLDWSKYWTCCGAWSPRNDALAYQQAPWAPGEAVEIHVVSLDGQSRMVFRHDQDPGMPALVDGWFPDGSKLLVHLGRRDGSGAIGTVPASGGPFTAIRAARLGSDYYDRAALSFDGRFVAFAEAENASSRDIHVVSVDGRSEYRVTDHPADDARPLWSPDGRHLAFISTRDGSPAVWAVAMNGGETAGAPFKIKDGMHDAWLLNWNARGIVYNQDTRTWDVFTTERESLATGPWTRPRPLQYDRTGRNMAAIWSPDGTQIAFVAGVPGEPSRRDIVVMPAGGGPAREYRIPSTQPQLFTMDLRWFGNGQGLGFSGEDSNGKKAVFRLTLAAGEWQVLPTNLKTWTRIEWNDDGSAFYFARMSLPPEPKPGIFRRDVKTGAERAIYVAREPFDTLRALVLSANRQWLAFIQLSEDEKKVDQSMVVALNLATGERRKLTTVGSKGPGEFRLQAIAWAPGDTAVGLLVTAMGARGELRLAPLDGGPVRVIPDVPLPSLSGSNSGLQSFGWSRDGRHLAFVVMDVPSHAFIIENPLAEAPATAGASPVPVRR